MRPSACAMWIWYRGDRFVGFQRQRSGRTVQQVYEEALGAIGVQKSPSPSGRTDRGVHARMQVVSFRADEALSRDPQQITERLNVLLSKEGDTGVVATHLAHPRFHAKWSAASKEYRYRVCLNDPATEHADATQAKVSAWAPYAWDILGHERFTAHPPSSLRPERLAEVMARYEGEHDFSAFHEKSSVRKLRVVESARVVELGHGVFDVRIRGEGFGRHQVRYMIGNAALCAAGLVTDDAFEAALREGAELRGLKAPASALVLWEVNYPPELDPFPEAERRSAPGVPEALPYCDR